MTNEINLLFKNVPFIRHDQYNYIKFQLKNITYAYFTTKDQAVLDALKLHSMDKINGLFSNLNDNQKKLLNKIIDIKDDHQAETYLAELKSYVIPFKPITEKVIANLFPKSKKLTKPNLKYIDFREITYLGWYDTRSERKYLVVNDNGNLKGIQGTIKKGTKGICSICNGHEEVGLFMAKTKSGKETYTKRGNYICVNSQQCNQNIRSLESLNKFIKLLSHS